MAAAEALGVNYRTMMACYDSRRVSRRMRQALEEFRDAGDIVGDEPGDDEAGIDGESLERRVAVLEEENHGLRELVEDLKGQLEVLGRRVDALEGTEEQAGDTDAGQAGDVQGNDQGRDWRPPRRRPGMPVAGWLPWRSSPTRYMPSAQRRRWWPSGASGGLVGSRVDRARAVVRRWELEVAMLGEFHLTLPPGDRTAG